MEKVVIKLVVSTKIKMGQAISGDESVSFWLFKCSRTLVRLGGEACRSRLPRALHEKIARSPTRRTQQLITSSEIQVFVWVYG